LRFAQERGRRVDADDLSYVGPAGDHTGQHPCATSDLEDACPSRKCDISEKGPTQFLLLPVCAPRFENIREALLHRDIERGDIRVDVRHQSSLGAS
jgi:hypothetical protein